MRRWTAPVATLILLLAALAWPTTRDALLFRNTLGADLPFHLYTAAAWLPLAWLVFGRPGPDPDENRARRVLATIPAALHSLIFLELAADPQLTRWMGLDFTPHFERLEGGLFPALQDAMRSPGPWLDWVAAYVYVYGYIFVYGILPAWTVLRAPVRHAQTVLVSLCLAWVVGFASFLLFPVNEPWTTDPAIANVLFERVATARDHFLLQWAVNNEFPSMHVATTFALATPLWFIARRPLAWMSPIVVTMPLVVVYLGIHWIADAVTGILLGIAAGVLSVRGWPASFHQALDGLCRPKI